MNRQKRIMDTMLNKARSSPRWRLHSTRRVFEKITSSGCLFAFGYLEDKASSTSNSIRCNRANRCLAHRDSRVFMFLLRSHLICQCVALNKRNGRYQFHPQVLISSTRSIINSHTFVSIKLRHHDDRVRLNISREIVNLLEGGSFGSQRHLFT